MGPDSSGSERAGTSTRLGTRDEKMQSMRFLFANCVLWQELSTSKQVSVAQLSLVRCLWALGLFWGSSQLPLPRGQGASRQQKGYPEVFPWHPGESCLESPFQGQTVSLGPQMAKG